MRFATLVSSFVWHSEAVLFACMIDAAAAMISHLLWSKRGNEVCSRYEEALLKFAHVVSGSELESAIEEAIALVIPHSGQVRICSNTTNTAIKDCGSANGWIRKVTESKRRTVLCGKELTRHDIQDFLEISREHQIGVFWPILDENTAAVQMIISFPCSQRLSHDEQESLDHLGKQIGGTLKRLRRLEQEVSPVCSIGDVHPIMRLCADLYDQDAGQLQVKLMRYLTNRTNSATGFLLMLTADSSEFFCQVVGEEILNEEIRHIVCIHAQCEVDCNWSSPSKRAPVRMCTQENLFSSLIQGRQTLWLKDIPSEKIKDVKEFVSSQIAEITSLMCVPVIHHGDDRVVAFAFLINKKDNSEFTSQDEDIVHECFHYTTAVLTSTIAFQTERRIKDQTQTLLQVAQNIFRKLNDLTVLLREIMAEARNLTHAERCSVFLLDTDSNELVAKVFDGLPTTSDKSDQPTEIRIPSNQGVAGHVATTGHMINITDAYSHHLFYRKVDEETGFTTRNILCFPIKDDKDRVVGVAQLCNKINGKCFTTFDEDIAKAFAVYCCISLSHSIMYKKVQESQQRSQLANELMTFHMKVHEERVETLSTCEIPRVQFYHRDFAEFSCVPRAIPENNTDLSVISMFDDLGFLSRWRISRRTLARFVLMVKKGYRDPAYHNWTHAYSVCHFAYLLLRQLQLSQTHITELEAITFLVSALCHDVDHRGTNNSFQVQSKSVLAALYSSEGSVLERHHISQTLCILNTEGCNIFANMSQMEYHAVLDLIRDIILATDLAHHLKIVGTLRSMAEQQRFDRANPEARNYLLCLLMTSADLSDQTKAWRNTRDVAEMIYKEFFKQGDLEKRLGHSPVEFMDREKAFVPDQQVSFLENIALPCFKIVTSVFPQCQCLVDDICRNRDHWEKMGVMIKDDKERSNSEYIFRHNIIEEDNVTH